MVGRSVKFKVRTWPQSGNHLKPLLLCPTGASELALRIGWITDRAGLLTVQSLLAWPAHTRWILYWAGQPVSNMFCTSSACQYELEKVQCLASQSSVKNHNPQLAY
jgi:hypothetical protein